MFIYYSTGNIYTGVHKIAQAPYIQSGPVVISLTHLLIKITHRPDLPSQPLTYTLSTVDRSIVATKVYSYIYYSYYYTFIHILSMLCSGGKIKYIISVSSSLLQIRVFQFKSVL